MIATAEPTTIPFILRLLNSADIPSVVALHQEAEAREPVGNHMTIAEYNEWLDSPFSTGAVITVAFATNPDGSAGKLVGELVVEKDERKNYALVELLVHPDYRLHGLGRTFYDLALSDARQRGANELRFETNQKHILLIDFLKRRGHELERYFWEMRLPAEAIVEQEVQIPEGFNVRTFVRGQDEQAFMDARNGSFAEHYGSVQRTLDEMTTITNLAHFDPDGLFLAFAANGEVAGLCWTMIDPETNEERGEQVGVVNTLGVVPAYQRHGLGRALLLTGVQHLRRSVPIVELGVEGKNAKALPLYEGVGFVRYKGSVNMIRELKAEEN